MKNFLKKYREMFAIFLYVFFVSAIIYFGIMPLYAEIKNRRDQIQEEIAKQEGMKKKLVEIPKIKEQYQKIKSDENKLDVLLSNEETVSLIEKLEKLAQSTENKIKIAITETNPNSRDVIIAKKNETKAKTEVGKKTTSIVEDLPSKDYLQIKITLNGKYNNVIKFMNKLENMQNYSDILSFQIKRSEESTASIPTGNPFVSQESVVDDAQFIQSSNDVSALLDVVFYSKK